MRRPLARHGARCLIHRARVTGLALALLAFACSDSTGPATPPAPPPHFLRWAPSSAVPAAGASGIALAPVLAPSSGAQVSMDWASRASGGTASLSWKHAIGPAANRLLVVAVSIGGNATDTVVGVTFGSAPLTFLGAGANDDRNARVELWYLMAPASGWDEVGVILSGPVEAVGGAASFAGVDQTAPFGTVSTSGSTGIGTADPSVPVASAVGDLVLAALATAEDPGVLSPSAGQTRQWVMSQGRNTAGAGSTALGADTIAMGWTKTKSARWAIAAVAVKPAPWTGPALDQFQVSVWAVRGQRRAVQINYLDTPGNSPQPFLQLDVTDPVSAPGIGAIALGDSVLITVTVDPASILVRLEPSGIQFGQPAQLHMWYGGAGGDLNGDGVVDGTDSDIESRLLQLWCQVGPGDPWAVIPAVQSALDRTFTAALPHFSNYAVAF